MRGRTTKNPDGVISIFGDVQNLPGHDLPPDSALTSR